MKGSLATHFHTVNTLQPSMPYWQWWSGRGACTRVGLWGSPLGPKVVKTDFFQRCPWTTWGAQVVLGYFDPLLTHFGPCNFPKGLEIGNFGTHIVVQGVAFGPKRWKKKCHKQVLKKMTPNHLGCSNRWLLAIFSYLSAIFPLVGPVSPVYLMFPPHQLGPNIPSWLSLFLLQTLTLPG